MMRAGQRGFGAIFAIVVLVVLAALAAAIVSFGTTQQLDSAQDTLSARAMSAARTGVDWGLYQALRKSTCNAAATTLDLSSDTGFWVSVSCTASSAYREGEVESSPGTFSPRTVTMYRIDATACNTSTCPDASAATTPGYVERKRQAVATN